MEVRAWLSAEMAYFNKRAAEFTLQDGQGEQQAACTNLWQTTHVKLREIIESLLQSTCAKQWPWLWMFYMHIECSNPTMLNKIYYRAIKYCGWHKLLYQLPQGPFRYAFLEKGRSGNVVGSEQKTSSDLQKLLDGVEDRGFFLRSVDLI